MLVATRHPRTVAALAVATISACGGGAGPAPPPPPPTPTAAPAVMPVFANVTAASGIDFGVGFSAGQNDEFDVAYFSGGVASGDYDGDDDVDLFIVRGDIGPNMLYRNDGNMSFTEVATTAGLAFTRSATTNYRHSGPAFADLDGDGDLDLFLGGVHGDPCKVMRNNGDGTFSDVTAGSGLDVVGARQTISSAFGDYDMDGDLDLLLAHWGTTRSRINPGDTEHLWRNISTGTTIRFESASVAAGLSPSIATLPDPRVSPVDKDHTFAPSFVHLNDDLYPDIAMVADFNTSQMFFNNGNGTFTNMTDVDVITETNGMGSALGDYDNDGDMDWFITSIYRPGGGATPNGNRLYRNDDGAFIDVTDQAGVADGAWGWGACFVDLENDGDLDIYHVNGWPFDINGDFSANPSRAFVADGNGVFVDQANTIGIADTGQGRGVVCADLDNDGDSDLFVWSYDADNGGAVYRNDSSGNNYLGIRLQGKPPNGHAIGARVVLSVGALTQMREVGAGSNFVSHNPATQTIGLGRASQADALIVEWPDGQVSNVGIVQANQRLVIRHPEL